MRRIKEKLLLLLHYIFLTRKLLSFSNENSWEIGQESNYYLFIKILTNVIKLSHA